MFMTIDEGLLQESLEITEDEVFDCSEVLTRLNVKPNYHNRFSEFSLLGIDEKGRVKFPAKYTIDLKEGFNEALMNEADNWHEKMYSVTISADDMKLFGYRKFLCSYLKSKLTNDDIANNRVNQIILDNLEELNFSTPTSMFNELPEFGRKLKTPKLSRLLVRAFGEKSSIVSYFNDMPRDVVSADDDYVVNVSILPHHIAGMSYYASGNHGGDDWGGDRGTSCQDTKRAGDSDYILKLPCNLKDASLGIAWLSFTDYDEVYEARALIRLVRTDDYEPFFIISRIYSTGRKATHILLSSLKTKYGELLIHHDEILSLRRAGDKERNVVVKLPTSVRIKYMEEEECSNCSGSGEVTEMTECVECDGTGERETECCDDGCDECDFSGFEDCYTCDGRGEVEDDVVCSYCEGDGVSEHEYSDQVPYVDEGFIDFFIRNSTEIHYNLPISLLKVKPVKAAIDSTLLMA